MHRGHAAEAGPPDANGVPCYRHPVSDEINEPKRPDATEKRELTSEDPELGLVADRELIRWSLSLSPEARLEVLQDFVDTFWTPAHG